jgi:NTE family protein
MGIDGRVVGFPSRSPQSPGGRILVAEPHPADQVARYRRGVVLHLSGGGYRAAAFHLGAVQRLAETGLLDRVTEVRTVSGGSLLAAALADEMVKHRLQSLAAIDWSTFPKRVRSLMRRDARTLPVLASLGINAIDKRPRLNLLERSLRGWCPTLLMRTLPERPAFCFLTTDILGGRFVRLDRRAFEEVEGLKDWPILRAAVASASFPPLYGPRIVRIKSGLLPEESKAAILDGGVWGNDGVDESSQLHAQVHLVSDASAPRKYRSAARNGPAFWSLRTLRATRERSPRLIAHFEFFAMADQTFAAARWSLTDSKARTRATPFELSHGLLGVFDYDAELVRQRIARVRTDLGGFSAQELGVVENHGYLACAHGIADRTIQLARALRADARVMGDQLGVICSPPHPQLLDETSASRALAGSDHRMALARIPAKLHERRYPLIAPLEERRRFIPERFSGDDWTEVLYRLQWEDPPRIAELLPEVTPWLARLDPSDLSRHRLGGLTDVLGRLVEKLATRHTEVVTNPPMADQLLSTFAAGWKASRDHDPWLAVRAAQLGWALERARGQTESAQQWARRAVEAVPAGEQGAHSQELLDDAVGRR